ncbi:single-stranded DNA-binding protein [Streptomyces sp. NPDC004528]|uniref:single-stranded DNA-binding protein n=1 Tax=Streptomyces sp. NPDC004528 TaxID=3154550 RepID=UPI0033AC3EBE
MAQSATHIIGTVTGNVECRFTEGGLAITRFRLLHTPREWDAAAGEWRPGQPVHYVCTAWRTLARNAAESLADGVHVMATGRISEVKDSVIFLSLDDLGLSLRERIAYTETSLPSPAAAAPVSPPPTTQSAGQVSARSATRKPGSPPGWWDDRRSSGWSGPGA